MNEMAEKAPAYSVANLWEKNKNLGPAGRELKWVTLVQTNQQILTFLKMFFEPTAHLIKSGNTSE